MHPLNQLLQRVRTWWHCPDGCDYETVYTVDPYGETLTISGPYDLCTRCDKRVPLFDDDSPEPTLGTITFPERNS